MGSVGLSIAASKSDSPSASATWATRDVVRLGPARLFRLIVVDAPRRGGGGGGGVGADLHLHEYCQTK